MGAPESRNPPGVAGFESADHGLGLQPHPITQRSDPPAPRDPQTIANELYQAAQRLANIAEFLAVGVPGDGLALANVDALLNGCGRLITELRLLRA